MIARLVLVLSLVLCASASAAEPTTKYGFVNGCFTVGDSGPLRFQAASLGEYLLIEADGTFRTGDGTEAEPGQDAIWKAGDDLALTNSTSEATLTGAVRDAEGCATIPEVDLNATGRPFRGARPYSGVRGWQDQHAHLMAFDFLGGNFHCGRPWSPFGVEAALPDCASIQGPQGANAPVQNFFDFGSPVAPHDTVGWPTFVDWPGYSKLSYEGTYWRWLERSWMGGLRLIESNMVDNEVLCRLLPDHKTSCNDMDSARRQTKFLFQLQDYIDAQSGGPGKGFLRIVTNPFQARRVINRGKLAVVMGIEVSRIFGCGVQSGDAQCTEEDIDRGLDEIQAMGIRSFFPIHKFDNAFGGTKMDGGPVGTVINAGNKEQTGTFWQVETCQTDQVDHDQVSPSGGAVELLNNNLGLADPGTFPVYPDPPHCNTLGLTALGEHVLRGMIKRHFLIEIDHMSGLAAQQSLTLLESKRYAGVLSSHTWANDINDLPRIYALGGSVTPYAGDSGGFVKKWEANRTAYRSKKFPFGIGYGADTNGLGAQGPPRPDAAENPVTYPFKLGGVTFERQVSGEQEYDINVDGVAHYGLYPDWVADLREIAGPKIVRDLNRGAESYLATWERAYGVKGPTCPAGRVTRRGVGKVRLGSKWRAVLRRAGQPWTRPGSAFRWCRPKIARKRGVGAYLKGGRVVLAGRRRAASKAVPLTIVRRGGRAFVSRGRSVAVATPAAASSKKRALRAMRAAGL